MIDLFTMYSFVRSLIFDLAKLPRVENKSKKNKILDKKQSNSSQQV